MSKELQYRVNIDTSKASTDVKNLNDELRETEQLTEVELVIKNAQAVQSVRELRTAYRQLQDAQLRVGEGTKEFNDLAAAAAQLRDRIDGVSEATRDLGGSATEQLTNSFSRLKEGIVNLDLDKVRQSFTQIRTSFIAFGESILAGIPALNGLTGATRTFTAALVATGIGAFVVALGLLIANFEKLKNSGGILGSVLTGIGGTITQIKNGIIGLADSVGLIDKATMDASDSVQASLNKQREAQRSIFDAAAKRLDQLKAEQLAEQRLAATGSKAAVTRLEQLSQVRDAALVAAKAAEQAALGIGAKQRAAEISELVKTFTELSKVTNLTKDQSKTLFDTLTRLGEISPFYAREFKNLQDELTLIEGNASRARAIEREIAEQKRIQDVAKAELDRIAKIKQADDTITANFDAARESEERSYQESLNVIKSVRNNSNLDILAADEIFYADQLAAAQDNYNRLSSIENDRFAAQTATNQQLLKQGLISDAEFNRRSTELATKSQQTKLDLYTTYLDKVVAEEQRVAAVQSKNLTDRLAKEDSLYDQVFAAEQLRRARAGQTSDDERLRQLDAERAFVERKLQILRDAGEVESNDYRNLKTNLLQIETDYQLEIQRLEEQTRQNRQQVFQTSLQSATQFTGALDGLIQTVYANEIAAAEGNFQEQERLRKESFEANKALQIVGAVMSTAQAVVAGLLAGLQMGGPWGIALGAITAAAAAATGAVQIATISATQYQPGTAPSSTTPSAGAATAGLPSAANAQPNINFVGAGVGGSVAGQGAQMPFPAVTIETQVSVSETEITSTQGLLSSYETGAGLGGG